MVGWRRRIEGWRSDEKGKMGHCRAGTGIERRDMIDDRTRFVRMR